MRFPFSWGGVINSLSIGYVVYKIGEHKQILYKLGLIELSDCDRADYWSVQAWSKSIEKLNLQCDVCFFGHSQIYGADFKKAFPNKSIVELGYPGDNLEGMLRRVDQIRSVHPEQIFIMAGTNSLHYKKRLFEQLYSDLIIKVKEQNPNASLYLFTILPQCNGLMGDTTLNALIRERNTFINSIAKSDICVGIVDIYSLYSNENGCLMKEVTDDGLHLLPNGYSLCYQSISSIINK